MLNWLIDGNKFLPKWNSGDFINYFFIYDKEESFGESFKHFRQVQVKKTKVILENGDFYYYYFLIYGNLPEDYFRKFDMDDIFFLGESPDLNEVV